MDALLPTVKFSKNTRYFLQSAFRRKNHTLKEKKKLKRLNGRRFGHSLLKNN